MDLLPAPLTLFWYFFCPVGTLQVRAYIDLTFRVCLRFLKVPQLVHVRKSRLRRQVLLGHRSRATKTLPSLVIGKGDFEHPVLQSPASRETNVVVCFPLGVQPFAQNNGLPT